MDGRLDETVQDLLKFRENEHQPSGVQASKELLLLRWA